jgi:hypothetical protein
MTYTQLRSKTMEIPVEPAVLSIHLDGGAGTIDVPVYIPWKHCQLVHAYTVTTVGEGNHAAAAIDFELNAAGGTAMGVIDIAQNAAVGDIDEFVISGQAACENLSSDNADRDAINLEVTDDGSSTWQGMLFMYFEVWAGE